jgi:maltose operon protein
MAAALLIQACTTPYGTALRQYREVPVCCSSLAELPVEQLQVGDKQSFELGGGSPAYRFDTGKSYFRAFALPQGPYPYRVTVRSFFVGDRLKSAYLFYPQLITLDGERHVVRSTGPGTFTLERAGLLDALPETGELPYKVEGGLTFTGDNRDERYLVVLTTDELLRGKTLVSTIGAVPMFIVGYKETVPTSANEAWVPHAPAGRVEVASVSLALQAPAGA